MNDVLRVDRAEGYAVVTLNRPAAKNALSRLLRQAIRDTMHALSADPGVQVVVLTGAGDAFCAGLDLQEIGASESALQDVLAEGSPLDALAAFEGPLVGAINGAAVTGGFELALGCDLLVASERACFADTHGRVGLLPIWGLSQRLSRVIGIGRAKELSLTGNFLDARRAGDWGLVNRVVPHDELLPQACALARDMASLAPGLLPAYKRLIDDGYGQPFAQALATEQSQANAFNAAQTAGAIAQRRRAVLQRGRQQASDPPIDPALSKSVHSNEAAPAPAHDHSITQTTNTNRETRS